MMSKIAVCILSSEAPFNGASLDISRFPPGIDFGFQGIAVGYSSVQALAVEDANLDLCHVEPARVLGCVVKLHATQKLLAARRPNTSSKHFLKWVLRLSSNSPLQVPSAQKTVIKEK
jgi:hypothetical protein